MVSHAGVGGDDKVTPSDISDFVLMNAAIHSEGSPVRFRAQAGQTSFLQSLGVGVGSRVSLEHCSSRLQPFGDSGFLQGLFWPLKWKTPSAPGVAERPQRTGHCMFVLWAPRTSYSGFSATLAFLGNL